MPPQSAPRGAGSVPVCWESGSQRACAGTWCCSLGKVWGRWEVRGEMLGPLSPPAPLALVVAIALHSRPKKSQPKQQANSSECFQRVLSKNQDFF